MAANKTYVWPILALGAILSTNAQNTLTPKEKERMANKVEVFTPDERDNIQMWFYEQTNKLGLSESTRNTYASILSDHIYELGRLTDKDKNYDQAEILSKIEEDKTKVNAKIKPLLTESQYQQHLEHYNRVLDVYIKRIKENK
ncbi:hypothetical protein [Mangrovimonas xylaniphaga]|uniref:hypothetical protein n=1 Tax=Mangrovimonas xylaniphaga TaxID=1645915 RepID=UPI0006B62880|nr:hypothetical protein [Mangrovimonas xylaniphaga]